MPLSDLSREALVEIIEGLRAHNALLLASYSAADKEIGHLRRVLTGIAVDGCAIDSICAREALK